MGGTADAFGHSLPADPCQLTGKGPRYKPVGMLDSIYRSELRSRTKTTTHKLQEDWRIAGLVADVKKNLA